MAKRRRKIARRPRPSLADRVKAAIDSGPLNTLLLNLQESVDKLNLSHVEFATGMKFVVAGQEEARQSRAGLHDKLNDVREDHAGMHARVGALEVGVAEIGEKVEKHEALYNQHIGRRDLIARLCGAITKGRAAVAAVVTAGGIAGYLHWPWWR